MRLTPLTDSRAATQASAKGYEFLGGKPLPIQQIRPSTSIRMGNFSMRGGVGFLIKQSLTPQVCAAKTTPALGVHEHNRYHQVYVPLRATGSVFHSPRTTSFYNGACHGPAAQLRKERMMGDVFTAASTTGAQPTLICTDINLTDASGVKYAIGTGVWVDIGMRFACHQGPEPAHGGKQKGLGQQLNGAIYNKTRQNCSRFANPHQPILKQPLSRRVPVIGICWSSFQQRCTEELL